MPITPENIAYTLSSDFFIPKNEEQLSDNWLERKIRDTFQLPPMPKVEIKFIESFLNANKIPYTIPEFPFADIKSHVGLEVEVENVAYINPNIPLCFWQITTDGSLRNHGKEFKTFAIPIRYAQIALEQLFQGLNSDIDFSQRTSIHVHLDVRGTTINQLLSLLFVYSSVENLLFKFAGADRRNSIFCTPITETNLFRELNISNPQKLTSHFNAVWQKYSALNLLPISQFGTVEFRQFPGTNDLTKLCIWIDLLSRIKLYAYKHSLTNIMKNISELNTTSQYRKFVDSVFGELSVYLDTINLLNDMEKPVYICKNCMGINEFHSKVLESQDRTSSLLSKFVSQKLVKHILREKYYKTFLKLYHETDKNQTEEEFYQSVQNMLIEYQRSFTHIDYITLFAIMHETFL